MLNAAGHLRAGGEYRIDVIEQRWANNASAEFVGERHDVDIVAPCVLPEQFVDSSGLKSTNMRTGVLDRLHQACGMPFGTVIDEPASMSDRLSPIAMRAVRSRTMKCWSSFSWTWMARHFADRR